MKKLLLVDSEVLPDVYSKVVMAKQLLVSGKARGVSDAVKKANISRSSYYKYKDFVFNSNVEIIEKRATIEISVENIQGILSEILDIFAKQKANILTINQTIPLNNIATLTITIDVTQMPITVDKLINKVKNKTDILEIKLLGIE
ncbi:MAG: ACT domain-containing protein [Peptostreptococcaceae bacterium]|jgi:UPF0735 protein CLD_1535|nr:ACT domain-containing protein [Peptostreptococcaceae bacterium]